MDTVEVNTVIVGGGHCGINMALWCIEKGISNVVLEKDVVFSKWKKNRWDSFMMNTPSAFSRLHGQKDGFPDTAMARPLQQDLSNWEKVVSEANIDVREHSDVVSVTRRDDGTFETHVKGDAGRDTRFVSKNVIACNGNYDKMKIPQAEASKLPSDVKQLSTASFKNAKQLNDGAVLVVGGGQSGAQISDALADEGKKVFWCSSTVAGTIRSYRHEDVFFWMDRTNFIWMTKEQLAASPMPKEVQMGMRYGKIPITGANKPISHHSLHRKGVTVLGSLDAVSDDGKKVTIKPNRPVNCKVAMDAYHGLPAFIEQWIEAQGNANDFAPADDYPDECWKDPVTELLEETGPLELSLTDNNITNVVWATGWTTDFSWIKIPDVLDGFDKVNNKPDKLQSVVPGFFFSGFHWLHTMQSGNLVGFEKDHEMIVGMLKQ